MPTGPLHRRWRLTLDVLTTAAMLIASSVLVWAVVFPRSQPARDLSQPSNRPRSPKPLPAAPVSLQGAPTQGQSSARIAVIEYSDFECPYCARFGSATYPEVRTLYVDTGKVLFAFRHLPLEHKHPSALRAAEAAECSGRQGRFWSMHDALFEAPKSLDMNGILAKARTIGLEPGSFQRCMQGEATTRVRQDLEEAQRLSISGTPTFLFGTIQRDRRVKVIRRESGAIPFKAFASILDDILRSSATGGT